MITDDKLRDEKVQYGFNREESKIALLSLVEIDKYDVLLSDQSRIIEQAKFTYSPLSRALEKQKQLKTKEKNR